MDSKIENCGTVMREKKSVDYIYLTKGPNNQNRVYFYEKEWSGIRLLQIEVREKRKRIRKKEEGLKKRKKRIEEKNRKRIKKRLQNYDIEQSVIGADEKMSEEFQLKELLFRARKQELLMNRERIFDWFTVRIPKDTVDSKVSRTRSTMLLVLGSSQWNYEEVLSILLAVKDYHEELYIVHGRDDIGIDSIIQKLYGDWGIVLHVVSEKVARAQKMDFILFLLEKWDWSKLKKYQYDNAYIVAEVEKDNLVRKNIEMLTEKKQVGNTGNVYSGLVYERQGKRIPYHMAVNIACQNPIFYKEFAISIVAIYCL